MERPEPTDALPAEQAADQSASIEESVSEPLVKHDAELDLAEEANPAFDLPLETPDGEMSFDIGSLIAPPLADRPASPRPVEEEVAEAPGAASAEESTGTPSRTINAIAPGRWDPSTPVRFGGTSLKAAVREAAHDEERRQTLRERLGMEKQELREKGEPAAADFVPLETEESARSDQVAVEQPVEEGPTAAVPDHISSPGPAGQAELSEEVKKHDFVGLLP